MVTLLLTTNKMQQHLCAVIKVNEEDAALSNKNINCFKVQCTVINKPIKQKMSN